MPRARWKQALLATSALGLVVALSSPIWWPLAAKRVLNSAWLRAQLNDQPDQLAFAWRSARALELGVLEVEGFTLRGQDDDVQWRLQIDHARVALDLRALLTRRFQTRSLDARGVRFRLRPRLPPWPSRRHLHAALTFPPIPGALPPVQPALRSPESTVERPERWSAHLRGVRVTELGEVWVAGWRGQTQGRASGDFVVIPGRFRLALRGGELEIAETSVWLGPKQVARGSRGKLKATLVLPDYRPLRGLAYLRPLLAKAEVRGELLAGQLLTPLVGRPAAQLGWARVLATVGLRDGQVTPKSALVLAAGSGTVQVAGVSARGPWQLRAQAEPPDLAVTVRMTPATLRSPVLAALTGPGVGVRTAALTLSGRVPLPAVRRGGPRGDKQRPGQEQAPATGEPAKRAPSARHDAATWVLRWAESEPAPLAPLLRDLNTASARITAGVWRAGGELYLTRPAPSAADAHPVGAPKGQIHGEIEARALNVVAHFAGQTLRGDVVATVPFRSKARVSETANAKVDNAKVDNAKVDNAKVDNAKAPPPEEGLLDIGALDIAGTRVRLERGRLFAKGQPPRPWSGDVTFRSGELGLAERPMDALVADTSALAAAVVGAGMALTPTLRARVTGHFTDAGPLLDVVRQRSGVPDFILRRVNTGTLQLAATLQLSPRHLRLSAVRITSADVDARGGLRLRGGALRGGLLVKVLGFSLGLELKGDTVATHLLRAERWFASSGW